MAHDMPLCACASCGRRDPELEYSRVDVATLPKAFEVAYEANDDADGRHVQCGLARNERERLGFVLRVDRIIPYIPPILRGAINTNIYSNT